MGKTCEPKAFSFQCMTEFTTKKKKKKQTFLNCRSPHSMASLERNKPEPEPVVFPSSDPLPLGAQKAYYNGLSREDGCSTNVLYIL